MHSPFCVVCVMAPSSPGVVKRRSRPPIALTDSPCLCPLIPTTSFDPAAGPTARRHSNASQLQAAGNGTRQCAAASGVMGRTRRRLQPSAALAVLVAAAAAGIVDGCVALGWVLGVGG